MSVIERAQRFVCDRAGHVERMIALPEDIFGLYAYSRIECSRCGELLSWGWTEAMQIDRLVALLDQCRAAATEVTP